MYLIPIHICVYRRPYFTGLRISTQTVSFTIDNFSSFLTQNRTFTALYTFLLLSGPLSDFIEDVELWLSTALIFNPNASCRGQKLPRFL